MKMKKLANLAPAAFAAVGVFLGRGAHADTLLTFDSFPPGQANNSAIVAGFGSNASASSDGVSVVGDGTPNIALEWSFVSVPGGGGGGGNNIEWDYYIDSVWSAVQLNNSGLDNDFGTNTRPHSITFTPASGVSVQLNSFNLHGYYNDGALFEYEWSVRDGTNVLTGASYSFNSDGTKDHLVSVNYTGSPGQALTLDVLRTGGDGGSFNVAADDISFAQIGSGVSLPSVSSVSPANGATSVGPQYAYKATIIDGTTQVDTNLIQLTLNGTAITTGLAIAKPDGTTTVELQALGVLPAGSTNQYTLTFDDTAANSVTNKASFVVQNYRSYEWRFTQGDFTPDLGNGILSFTDGTNGPTAAMTTFGTTDGTTVSHINGQPATYMFVPALADLTNGYLLEFTDSGPNGGGEYINRHTFVFDIHVPGELYWIPFFNTDPGNSNDADFYLGSSGEMGSSPGYSSPGVVAANTWHRVATVTDLAARTLTYYVDGVQVHQSEGADGVTGLDTRWALYSNANEGPDVLLFNEGDTLGQYTDEFYLSSVYFTDRAMTAMELAAMGGPNAQGILVRPNLNLNRTDDQVVISWPTNSPGFILESATSLANPDWSFVGLVFNNTFTMSVGDGEQYFRLRQ